MTNNSFTQLQYARKSENRMIADVKSFYNSIKSRRSIRDFSEEVFPLEIIDNAILAAGTAPNGANLQPWHFVVVSDPEIKREIRVAAEKEEKEFYQQRASDEWLKALRPFSIDEKKPFLEKAPCLIAVFIKNSVTDEKEKLHKTYYPLESVGIATGMLISALHFAGLATLTHTPSPMGFLNNILDRPDSERPFLIIVTGYPHENAQVPNISKKKINEISSYY